MDNSFESHLQHTFDSYCRKVVRNEARNIEKHHARERKHKTSLDYLPSEKRDSLFYFDHNVTNSEIFVIDGMSIEVSNDNLIEAIKLLSENLREIILLYYFVGLNDREIGERYNLSAGGLWAVRQRAVRFLQLQMEVGKYE